MRGSNPRRVAFLAFLVLGGAAALFFAKRSPLPRLDLEIVPIGHQEIQRHADGRLLPWWIGEDREIGLCVEAPLDVDSSLWQARFFIDGRSIGEKFEEFTHRSGSALCFSRAPNPWPSSSSEAVEICVRIRDGYDGRVFSLPCFAGRYDLESAVFNDLERRASAIFGARSQLSQGELFAQLEALIAESSERGFSLFGLYLRLAMIYEQRRGGTPESLADAARRLESLPPWLAEPEAVAIQTTVIYERAMLALARRELYEAWRLLSQAADEVERFAGAQRTVIALQQAEILNQVGAGREAVRRLRAVLDDELWPPMAHFEPEAHAQLGWLLVMDPDADAEDLASARRHLDIAAASDAVVRDDRERANMQIQLAWLSARTGADPAPHLEEARRLLHRVEANFRSRLLLGWADVVQGQAILEQDPQRALALCSEPAASPLPRLAGLAWSCLGRAHRRLSSFARAQQAFDQALLRHELATPVALAQDLPLAPSQRADDYYRAARIAVDRSEPRRAWRILESLDRLAIDRKLRCQEADPESREELETRRRELWRRLAITEPPFSPHRQRQLEPLRNSTLEALEELHRRVSLACRGQAEADDGPVISASASPDIRAFALPEEVLVLRRLASGGIVLAQRSDQPRLGLVATLDRLSAAQEQGTLDDAAWRALARPLAELLVPALHRLGDETFFALHGVLQRTPLAALPTAARDGKGWLGESTIPVLLPALANAGAGGAGQGDSSESTEIAGLTPYRRPVFVVDPLLDLPSGLQGLETYRQLFPGGSILYGSEATRERVLAVTREASFLHLDAHGELDTTFPGLTGLKMADGLLTAADFVSARPPHFANLSGCQTGRSSDTADSGRYGLAGALVRLGATWVIASASPIEDRLSRDFNRDFYRHFRLAPSVPGAFAQAHGALRARYPAAAWSNVILLGQPAAKTGDARFGEPSKEVPGET